jgi:hypothetical protein
MGCRAGSARGEQISRCYGWRIRPSGQGSGVPRRRAAGAQTCHRQEARRRGRWGGFSSGGLMGPFAIGCWVVPELQADLEPEQAAQAGWPPRAGARRLHGLGRRSIRSVRRCRRTGKSGGHRSTDGPTIRPGGAGEFCGGRSAIRCARRRSWGCEPRDACPGQLEIADRGGAS